MVDSVGTGEIVYFGAHSDNDLGFHTVLFPSEMGAVKIVQVRPSMIILENGKTAVVGGLPDPDVNFADFPKSNVDPWLWLTRGFHQLGEQGVQLQDIQHQASEHSHALALTAEGEVYAFGRNQHGQLGLSHCRDVQSPTLLARFPERVARVACGHQFSVAVTVSGGVYCWGNGTKGQCAGHQGAASPKFVPALFGHTVVEVQCGHSFVAALNTKGQLFTWGSGLFNERQNMPTQVPLRRVRDFACGFGHMAALTDDGKAYAWGLGLLGALGLGEGKEACFKNSPTEVTSFQPPLAPTDRLQRVFCGDFYTAYVTARGHVYTCGHNKDSRLGHRDDNIFWPTQVTAIMGKPVSLVSCSQKQMICFIPTRLIAVSDAVVSVGGNTALQLSGVGIYDTKQPVCVNFAFQGRHYNSNGRYDSFLNRVLVTSPAFSDPQDDADLGSVEISLSLDGSRYSNSLTLGVFRMPASDRRVNFVLILLLLL
jgi:hypothetical protein